MLQININVQYIYTPNQFSHTTHAMYMDVYMLHVWLACVCINYMYYIYMFAVFIYRLYKSVKYKFLLTDVNLFHL